MIRIRFGMLLRISIVIILFGSLLGADARDFPRDGSFIAMPPHPTLLDEGKLDQRWPTSLKTEDRLQIRSFNSAGEEAKALTGTINALAVLVDFSDKVKTVQASFYDSLLFAAPQADRGSVRDYFSEVSYGQIDIVTVDYPSSLGWQRLPQTHQFYTAGGYCIYGAYPNNCQRLAEDLAVLIDPYVDFSDYDNDNDGSVDNLMIIHAGPGAEYTDSLNDIWSHSWRMRSSKNLDGKLVSSYVIMPEYYLSKTSTGSDVTIGVFAHEMGHGFWDLPDFYDTSYQSQGVGYWSLMGGGSWNGSTLIGGDSPAWPSAWERIRMGIAVPTSLDGYYQQLSIPQINTGTATPGTIYKLQTPNLGPDEYFLLENRQQIKGTYDEYLPGSGLLIWHVDDSMTSNDGACSLLPDCSCGSHYKLSLEQADGLKSLERKYTSGGNDGDSGDPFPGASNQRSFRYNTLPGSDSFYTCGESFIAINNISDSAEIMTADIQVGDTPTLLASSVTTWEEAGSIQFSFELSNPSITPVSFNVSTADDSAKASQDYLPISDHLIIFDPGERSKQLSVTLVDDDQAEPAWERFLLMFSDPDHVILPENSIYGNILDEETLNRKIYLPGVIK